MKSHTLKREIGQSFCSQRSKVFVTIAILFYQYSINNQDSLLRECILFRVVSFVISLILLASAGFLRFLFPPLIK